MSLECCVCLENEWVSQTPCKHFICIKCLIKLKKDECPICRKKILSKLPTLVKNVIYTKEKTVKNISPVIDTNDLYQFPPLS